MAVVVDIVGLVDVPDIDRMVVLELEDVLNSLVHIGVGLGKVHMVVLLE